MRFAAAAVGAARSVATTAGCGAAPDTGTALEQSADKPCAEAILAEDLPEPGAVVGTDVYGQRAPTTSSSSSTSRTR
ncbi:hypothetical protein ACGFI4_17060 [Micromonospora carbonacea]|uniref:hypothetical protein n=1 Tax=Micromonospora carbonacea TaxID=47853 RepID=UPI00371F0702